MASALSLIAFAAFATVANAQSLEVVNKCSEDVFLFTQTSFGTIKNNVVVAAGASTDMGISSNWDGAVNTGMLFSRNFILWLLNSSRHRMFKRWI
jgi:hypothetical protein